MENAECKTNLKIYMVLAILLFVPSFLQSVTVLGSNRQLIIGTVVNTGLFLCASYVIDKKKIIAFSILPSISSICSGLLFAGLTKWSIIMMPFIWLGNLSLIYGIKYLCKKTNYVVSRGCAIIIKVLVIYLGFLIVSNLFNYPAAVSKIMSKSMGLTQLYTCLFGFFASTLIGVITKQIREH